MKKILAIIMAFIMMLTLTACNNNNGNVIDNSIDNQSKNVENPGTEGSEKLTIVTTVFPAYDWVREIIGEKSDSFELTFLLDNNVDTHSYQPSISDIAKISNCDMFIYVGGHSDEAWIDDVLAQATNPDMVVVNLLEELGDRVLWVGHDCSEDDHHDDHDDDEEECEEHEELEEEEHVWVSLKNAVVFISSIVEALYKLDPDNADIYAVNAGVYVEKLQALDALYQEAVEAAEFNALIFADRFPFQYLTNDYGLEHHAAFSGCSAETEASFETIVFLAIKLDELGLNSVIVIDGSDKSIAETVIAQSSTGGQQIFVLDSIKSVTSSDTTYISIMESNLEILKEALK